MILARLHIDEHSRCYESSKSRGFYPQIPIFASTASFWSKTKIIFAISSSNCIGSYIVKTDFLTYVQGQLRKKVVVLKKHLSEKPRNQRVKLRRMMYNTICFQTKIFFENFASRPPQAFLGKKICFLKKLFISFKTIF